MPNEIAYVNFLKKSLADNTIGSYKSALSGEPLKRVLGKFGFNSIYDISDIDTLSKIKNAAKDLPENGHNTITSAIQKYIDLIQVKEYSNNNSKSTPISPNNIPIFSEIKSVPENPPITKNQIPPLQQIFFGAPGTGKSFKVNQKAPKDDKVTFRTTFHPDYDYAQFVGSYKPKKDKDDPKKIVYEFVPQVFANAYVAAWKNYLENQENPQPVYLVIEEINRGNCAQIFGDIFQLLDRDDDGFSRYEIDADADFAEWLKSSEGLPTLNQVQGDKLRLPPNFNILATMNTSDQSLFPMDSAFKRRFDWKYVPIAFKDKEGTLKPAANYKIKIGDSNYSWEAFVTEINKNIHLVTNSEDKQLGEFFVKLPKDKTEIDENVFKSKVLFYLWDSVYKDEGDNTDAKLVFHFKFPDEKGETVTFQSLFKDNSSDIIKRIFKNLGVDAGNA